MKIGIVKSIDKLGRIVIPKKYRELYKIEDSAEVILTDEGILLRAVKQNEDEREEKK